MYVIIVLTMGGKNSNHLKQALRKFSSVRNWQLLLIFIPLVFVTATLLRLDHLKMTALRRAVLEADAANDDVAIEENLTKLRDFVFSHVVINVVESNGTQSVIFGTGPFYLENQYLRAANAAIEAAEANLADDANPNGNIYAAVSAICKPLAIENGWNWNSQGYLDCWTSELAKYPTSDELSSNLLVADLPSTELYRINYASPIWTFSWASLAIIACLIILIVVIIRIFIWCILNISLLFLRDS